MCTFQVSGTGRRTTSVVRLRIRESGPYTQCVMSDLSDPLHWGTLDVDLLVSCLNRKLLRVVTRDPLTCATDALVAP